MAVQKAVSGNPVRNNGSRLLFAGNVDRAEIGSLDYGTTSMDVVTQPNISGLTAKAISSGPFNVDNQLVAMGLNQSIAGVSIAVIKSGSGIQNRQNTKGFRGYTRSDIASFDMFTGLATYGPNAGAYVSASGLDGTVGVLADEAVAARYAVPGRLVYQFGSNVPKEQSYTSWTG
jgi:hypothetical protein